MRHRAEAIPSQQPAGDMGRVVAARWAPRRWVDQICCRQMWETSDVARFPSPAPGSALTVWQAATVASDRTSTSAALLREQLNASAVMRMRQWTQRPELPPLELRAVDGEYGWTPRGSHSPNG
ncbi:hypothetical protein GCM10009740_32140 [Terrabacter terrae]|uniref:Uncharacterized protein n=1 Tax=Terrabacter terrae TaxID=318434 RepID=A0ABN2UIB2_9MICO